MNNYMKAADKLARENLKNHSGGPFGACIVKNGEIIGKGSNHVLLNNDPTAHAEVMAIRDACRKLNSYDLSGCTLYTTCYPCPMCLSATIWANIKDVYYGNTKQDADKIGFRDDYIYEYIGKLVIGNQNQKILNLKQIERDETIKTFEEFSKMRDTTIY